MKTAGRGNPNHWRYSAHNPRSWRGSSEQISLDDVGWEGRKTLAAAEVFLLDFLLYRTFQELTTAWLLNIQAFVTWRWTALFTLAVVEGVVTAELSSHTLWLRLSWILGSPVILVTAIHFLLGRGRNRV